MPDQMQPYPAIQMLTVIITSILAAESRSLRDHIFSYQRANLCSMDDLFCILLPKTEKLYENH